MGTGEPWGGGKRGLVLALGGAPDPLVPQMTCGPGPPHFLHVTPGLLPRTLGPGRGMGPAGLGSLSPEPNFPSWPRVGGGG